MKKLIEKILTWWAFHMANPVIWSSSQGAFAWTFRRFWLEFTTLSGNFKVRIMAGAHPYAALLEGMNAIDVHAFAAALYQVGMLLTTDQKFVDDLTDALVALDKRASERPVEENAEEEASDVSLVRSAEEYADKSPKERRKIDRDANGRFKKLVKKVEAEKK